MARKISEGLKRWQEYMQFKNDFEAFLKFHLPLIIIFLSTVFLSTIVILATKNPLLTGIIIDVLLWVINLHLIYHGFIKERKSYLNRFGKAAYRVAAFRFILTYGGLWLTIHTLPLWALGKRCLEIFPFSIFGLVFIVLGFLLMNKTIDVLGIDRLTYVYSYFPEDAPLVKSAVFEFIRHPAYAAWIYMEIGFFFLRGTILSLACVLLNFIGLCILIRIEENDIIRNFKEDYDAYRRTTAAFLPKKPIAFLKYLLK